MSVAFAADRPTIPIKTNLPGNLPSLPGVSLH